MNEIFDHDVAVDGPVVNEGERVNLARFRFDWHRRPIPFKTETLLPERALARAGRSTPDPNPLTAGNR